MDISEPDIVTAWRSASDLLLGNNAPYILTLSASGASEFTAADLRRVDAAARAVRTETPSSVANMLLPAVVERHAGTVAEATEAGLNLFGRGRRRGRKFSQWQHTYFERLVGSSVLGNGTRVEFGDNKLAALIHKLLTWPNDVQAALYLHNFRPTDTFRTRGSPCLQYLQFRPHSRGRLDLVALYRSHDYSAKALGNLIALQRLGQFVARHSGRRYEATQVVSLHPHISLSKGLQRRYADDVLGN